MARCFGSISDLRAYVYVAECVAFAGFIVVQFFRECVIGGQRYGDVRRD
jgi:hypothetical protein